MSRSRSAVLPAPYIIKVGAGEFEHTVGFSKDQALSQYYGSAHSDSRYRQLSTIIDQIPTQHLGAVDWKSVSHQKVHAYPLGAHKVKFTFSPPTPDLWLSIDVPFAPTALPTPSVNWDKQVDQLAQQLERGSGESFQAMVFIAEAHKSWEMLKNPLSFLKRDWRKTVKTRPAKTIMDSSTSLWLSYRYGWTPFKKDIDSFAKLSANVMSKGLMPKLLERFSTKEETRVELNNVAGSCSETQFKDYQNLRPWYWSSNLGLHYYMPKLWTITTTRLSAYAFDPLAKLTNTFDRLLTAAGATASWRNIRDVLWEVLPYSFVIDWFVDFNKIWRPLNEHRVMQLTSRRVGYSIKTVTSAEYQVVYGNPKFVSVAGTLWSGKEVTNLTSPSVAFTCINASKTYTRSEGIPASTAGIFSSRGISLLHGIDGITLSLQKLSNRH